jgi:hypothetical protein
MNSRIIYSIAGALALLGSTGYAGQDDNGQALKKSYPVQLYMNTCVAGHGQAEAVASLALKMGLEKAPVEQSKHYLLGSIGTAWYTKNDQGEFGIATMEKGLCSVFIHQGNPETLQASLESWLPPESTGFSHTKELVSQSGILTTTAYKIFRGTELMEQWVITVSSLPESRLAAIISYNAP